MTKIVIQYQTHQILTNEKSLNSMYRQLLKIETPRKQHSQTTHNQTTQSKH